MNYQAFLYYYYYAINGVDAKIPTGRIKESMTPQFIPDSAELEKTVNALKEKGLKIVLTQGVFDLIHEGHARYLEAAKSYGDVLIVGADSDELTRLRKGPNRPVVPQDERIRMLMHLRHIDFVTVREAHHGIGDLIKLVKPHVLVTSSSTSDFTDDFKSEYAPFCSKIVTLPPQATTTTSARIRNLSMDGAEQLAAELHKLTDDFIKKIREG